MALNASHHHAPPPPAMVPMTDSTPTLYALLLTVACTIVMSFGRARSASLLMVLGGPAIVHSIWLGVPGEFWAHVLFGVVCVTAGAVAGRTGQLVSVPAWQGGAASLIFVGLIIGEYATVGFGNLKYVAHVLIYVSCLLLTLSATAEDMCERCCGLLAWRLVRIRVRLARVLIDPSCLASIGIIFMAHRHDPSDIAIMFHRVQSALLLSLALVVGSTAAASTQPAAAAAGPGLHTLHVFCWVLNGFWLLGMAVLLYLWRGRRGIHHTLYAGSDAGEAATLYFALTLLASATAAAALTGAGRKELQAASQPELGCRAIGRDDTMAPLTGGAEGGES